MFGKDTMNTKFTFDGKMVKLSYAPMVRRQRPATAPEGGPRPGGFGRGAGGAETALPASATRLSGVRQWKRVERNRSGFIGKFIYMDSYICKSRGSKG